MKYIDSPPDVGLSLITTGAAITDENGVQATVSFKMFLKGRLMDPAFGKDASSVIRASKIHSVIESSNAVLAFEDVDYELLAAAIKNPSPGMGYDSRFSHCLVPFFVAFESATESAAAKKDGGE